MSKELTKEQKLVSIENALKEFKASNGYMCCSLSSGMMKFTNGSYMGASTVSEYIPEMNIQNITGLARKNHLKLPKGGSYSNGWWDSSNRKIRITMLNLLKKQIENPPPMIAKLVTFTITTRVVVPQNATDEQICITAVPRLSEKIVTDLKENIECIVDDIECPYETGEINF
jgi:hypothetical protein